MRAQLAIGVCVCCTRRVWIRAMIAKPIQSVRMMRGKNMGDWATSDAEKLCWKVDA